MWSIDSVEMHMRDQIRAAALAFDAIESGKKPARIRRVGRWVRAVVSRLRRDPITTVLVVLAIGSFSAAIWLLWTAQPIGGGTSQSSLAITQGASLIFVVILTTLLFGPLEAGRSLGTDAAWIARDVRTWLGLAVISVLSVTMLLLGWAKPDSREELSTIFMTALGLAMTGLLVRHLLRLSDPLVQVGYRRKQSVRRLGEVLRASRERSESALKKSGVSDQVAEQIQHYADPTTQAAFASESRTYTSIARAACGRADWHLATGAYANAVALALEYLRQVDSVADADEVLLNLVGEADDLNRLAQGPAGRPFAEALIRGMHVLGLELITVYRRSKKPPTHRSVSGLSIVARAIQTMAGRELADMNASGPASAMRIIGDFATRALTAGAWASASHFGDILIHWALTATNASQNHVAIPAWAESLRLLVLMFNLGQQQDHALMNGACNDLAFALEKVEPSVISLPPSGLDPIIESSSLQGDMTLQLASYELWKSDCWALPMVAEFGLHVAWRLTSLLRGLEADFSKRHFLSHELTEVLYQFICAAATRSHSESDPACRTIPIESTINTLGWIRGWMMPEEELPDKNFDLAEMLHCYISGWQILLFTERGTGSVRPALVNELRTFLSRLTPDVTKVLPSALEEGLALLETWLRTVGYPELADEVKEKLDAYEGLDGFFDTQHGWGGLDSPYHTRRGGLIPGVVTQVEDFFDQQTPS